MMNHRCPEFKALLAEIQQGLRYAFQTENEVILLTASGTGGLEAALVNTLSPGDKVLAISIGAFGDRFAEIAAAYGADVERLAFDWGTAADPEAVQARLAQDEEREIKAVLVTHNETSTGVTNDLEAIADVVRAHGALLLVDAISGLVALPLPTDAWGLDVVVAGSQKAFMIPPGLAFVSVGPRAWEAARQARMPRFYWDFQSAHRYAERGETPFTPAVSLVYALVEALRMIREDGLETIQARHARWGRAVRAGLTAMGLQLLASGPHASNAITAAYVPEGVDGAAFRRILNEQHHIVIARGQGALRDRIFRVGHLGYVNEVELVGALLQIGQTLRDLGAPVAPEAGWAAAQAALRGSGFKIQDSGQQVRRHPATQPPSAAEENERA